MMTPFKIRAIYLLLYMAFAIWRVFYNIYLEDIGLKGSEIGTLNAVLQSSILFVVAYWGMVADKKGIRSTLRILVLATSVAIFFLAYINEFWLLLIYIPLISVFFHPLGPLADALSVQYCEVDKRYSYGSFRLWGSLGWSVASILGGLLFSRISLEYIFPVSAGLFILVVPFLITYKRKRIFTPNFETFSGKELIRNKPLLMFIGVITLYGITCSPVNSYLNLYFRELKSDNNIVGIAYSIMAFSELPLFIIGNKVLKKIGARKVILIAMYTMGLRLVLYGIFPGVYLGLAVGALQGISLAFFLVGVVDYLKNLMPQGRHAAVQSIVWGSYVGLGQVIGNLVIGLLIDKIGMVGVMQLFIGVAAICILLTIAYFKRYKDIVV